MYLRKIMSRITHANTYVNSHLRTTVISIAGTSQACDGNTKTKKQ